MYIGNYAASKPYVCLICKGKGCNYCNQNGIKIRNLQVISEQPLKHQHIKVQAHLKTIKGSIVKESVSKDIKVAEVIKDD